MSEHQSPSPGPPGCNGDAAAYALGALDAVEAEVFRRHLDTCVVCRDELAAFERVVDVLPASVPQYRAPAALRRRIRREVRSEAKQRTRPATAKALARRKRPQWGLASGAALVAAIGAAIVAVVLATSGAGHGTRLITAQVVGPGSAQVRVSGGHAEIVLRHFPAPPAGDVYEVWLQTGTAVPKPARTLFDVGAHGAAQVNVTAAVAGATRLMVTPERQGGSPAPTHAPVIIARLD